MTAREEKLKVLQEAFPSFVPFLIFVMAWLGFKATRIQRDIANFLEFGPKDLMVQAQRGEAKTTITAIFAVWCLIHNPKWRILIVSAGGSLANEISTLIVRIILNLDVLECMRPDRNAGDRVSVEHFDIHWSLKGVDKSPSIACMGVTATTQGRRADLLIADDVESAKNSRTAMMREILLQLIRDFPSVVRHGRILYLGTPQTDSSIYNTLPQSGFTVRIWPGRYPTPEQLENYGDMLAPLLRADMEREPALCFGGGMAGDQGQPTDPELFDEESLQAKERKQGVSFFQLQHMLCSRLADEARYPLKSINLVVMRLAEKLPLTLVRGMTAEYRREFIVGSQKFPAMAPMSVSVECELPTMRMLHIDPAGGGQNGDETGYAVIDHLNGNLFIRAVGGVPGGYDPAQIDAMVDVVAKWRPTLIHVEKNFGHGAYTTILMPRVKKLNLNAEVKETYESGQKEVRIADTLEPVLGRGSLVIDEDVILGDWDSTAAHPADKRQLFTFAHQFAKLTRDRGALVKDDRLDALAGGVGKMIRLLGIDPEEIERQRREAERDEWMRDPMGHTRYQYEGPIRSGRAQSVLRTRRRR